MSTHAQGWANTTGAPHPPPPKKLFTPPEIPPNEALLRSLPACPLFQGRVLQVRDPHPAACTALSCSPCVLGSFCHVDNLFNEAINSNLRPWLEDIPVPQPGIPSGMEPSFVSRSPAGQG